jgi:hypothetical protein
MIGTYSAEIYKDKIWICFCEEDESGQAGIIFENKKELEEFIANLQRVADEAWPKNEETENSYYREY